MAEAQRIKSAEQPITVMISNTVRVDMVMRGVFPRLCSTAHVHSSGHAYFDVSPEEARSILADLAGPTNARGLLQARWHLRRSIEGRLEVLDAEAEGIGAPARPKSESLDDLEAAVIGSNLWLRSVGETPARFQVGEVVRFNGERHEVSGGFGMQRVVDEEGPYFDDRDGSRFCVRFGYLLRAVGGEIFFAVAGEVGQEDGEMRHLRLVPAVDERAAQARG